MKNLLLFFFLFFGVIGKALGASPGSLFTYEGVLTDTSGTPITTSQLVTFQIIYGSSCIVYEETQVIAPGTQGEFSVIVGAGTRTDTTSNTADRIFASSGSVGCHGAASVNVTGFATRSLHIRVGSTDLSPDVTIGNIPFAINAQKLADKGPSDFVQTSPSITQSNVESIFSRYSTLDQILNSAGAPAGPAGGDLSGTYPSPLVTKLQGIAVSPMPPAPGNFLQFDGSQWVPGTVSGGAGGTVTNIATGTGLTGGPIATSGTISLANTSVVPSSYGNGTAVASFTVDAQGRLTSASNMTINFPVISVAGKTSAVTLDYGDINSAVGKYLTYKPNNTACADGQVLKWVTANARWECAADNSGLGTVTAVTGSAPIVVTGSTTPNISINDATATTKGAVQVGAGLSVAAGVVSVDPLSFPGTLPISKGGTGTTAFVANRMIASDGTGNSLTTFQCGFEKMVTFDATGMATCTPFPMSKVLLHGGNSLGEDLVIGTNDPFGLQIKTGGITRMVVDTNGKIGVGTMAPMFKVSIFDSIVTPLDISSDSTAAAGIRILNTSGSNVTAWNMVQAGSSSATAWGQQGAFSIKYGSAGSPALTIQPGGNVGLGTNAPAQKLDLGGGNIAMGYERINSPCSAATTCVVTCGTGKFVMGGGCSLASPSNRVVSSYPNTDTSWTCVAGVSDTITAWAICANMR